MPLQFEPEQEEGFSLKRFLKSLLVGTVVLLGCIAFGYYVLGPRLEFTPDGKPRFRFSTTRSEPAEVIPKDTVPAPTPPSTPQVEVYEKTPGSLEGDREVAPYNYDEFGSRPTRRSRQPKKDIPEQVAPTEESAPPTGEPGSPPAEEMTPPDTPETPGENPTPPSEPPAKPPSEPPNNPPSSDPRVPQSNPLYRVQVGIYANRENANHTATQLREQGFEAAIVPFQRNGTTVYRVQVHVTHDRQKADKIRDDLKAKGFEAHVAKVE